MLQKEHDVLIVGSGHAGGMAAKVLTEKGISCLILEAGPEMDYQKDRVTKPVHELPYRGFNKPGRLPHVIQANEFNANQWVDEKEVPYTHPPDAWANWVRVRLVGGRSHFWARQSFRLSDFEFKPSQLDGGVDWPFGLAEVAPYYSRVEAIFKVSGRKEGWPQFPDGDFVETNYPPDSGTIRKFTEVCNQRGIGVSKMRASQGQNGLASSINLLLPDALATGKLDIVSNAIVRQLRVDKNTGLVNGAYFVDRHSGREMEVKAKVVVLAAGSLESTRLLLNSGLANSSGLVGRYLVDQLYGVSVVASVPEARDGKAPAGLMGGTALVPRFRNLKKNEGHNFIKGYCINVSSGGGANPHHFAAYGEELEQKLESYAGSCVTGSIYAERLARYENHVSIDKKVVDAWGIPVIHMEYRNSQNEYNLARDAADTIEDLFRGCGWDILSKSDRSYPPGRSIHEMGTCRMGNNPKTSVLNPWSQSHDIRNLFVVDAAGFVTCGWQNPTMTILALSMRASEHLADLIRQGAV